MEKRTCSECEAMKEALQGIDATLKRMETVLLHIESVSVSKYNDEIYEKCGTLRSFA